MIPYERLIESRISEKSLIFVSVAVRNVNANMEVCFEIGVSVGNITLFIGLISENLTLLLARCVCLARPEFLTLKQSK